MTPDEKFNSFLKLLPSTYMVESFYSLWKPEAKRILTLVNIPAEKHNEAYVRVVTLAAAFYKDEVIPFIINVGTREVSSEPMKDEESDALIGSNT